ncbi:histidine phosphatase family protein [Kibdelosporangium phytohabitans]|uniref:histidine phosphatase family protein n=1 Tax=Kibdelosporangium phytohabitans TaxID=860235 RepID=UPI0009F8CA0C|nr:histidine phosphatase family protein [Kibdelosporangium phytohabitans]MBE1468430.1 broad specificity phosphatase PhoE [Kibdelosporangium phytohabitans]
MAQTALLIRHGESRTPEGNHTTASTANPLTPLGEEQAALVAEMFTHAPDLVVTSPLLRARQTAQPTIDRFPSALVEEWPIEEFARLRHKPPPAEPRTADPYWEAADPHHRDDERPESFVDVYSRALGFLTRMEESGCSQIVAFTHGMFMRVVVWAILTGDAVPDSGNMRRFRAFHLASVVPHCSILPLVSHRERGYQVSLATTAHLPVALQSGGC